MDPAHPNYCSSTTTLSFRRRRQQQQQQQQINFAYKPQTIIASYHLVRFSSLTYLLVVVVFVLSRVPRVFIYLFYDRSPQHSRPLFTLSTKNLRKALPPHRFLSQRRAAQLSSVYILCKPRKARDKTSE